MGIVTIKNAVVSLWGSGQESEPIHNNTNTYGAADSDMGDVESQKRTSEQNAGFLSNIDPRVMSDVVIGLSDGLTVPFALTAGLSSLGDSKIVITGGMAELVSGAISMGLGGFLAARSEADYYKSQVKREKQDFFRNPEELDSEVEEIMLDLGASQETIQCFIRDLQRNPKAMIDFIIRFGRGLEEPAEGRQLTSALTIGGGYFFGGFIPLVPYFFTDLVKTGFVISCIVMVITLFIFGFFKAFISLGADCSTPKKISEGFQMVVVGSVAAGSAWALVRLIDT